MALIQLSEIFEFTQRYIPSNPMKPEFPMGIPMGFPMGFLDCQASTMLSQIEEGFVKRRLRRRVKELTQVP